MPFPNKATLLEEIMDDEDKHCGPAGSDHDWALFFSTGHVLYSVDFSVVIDAIEEDPDTYAECMWCAVICDHESLDDFKRDEK